MLNNLFAFAVQSIEPTLEVRDLPGDVGLSGHNCNNVGRLDR